MTTPPPTLPLPKAHGIIALSSIIIPDRLRTSDAAHIAYIQNDLAPSILESGLINPITLNNDERTLRAGYSRVKAFEFLGYTEIPYNTLRQCSSSELLAIEFAENEVRHPMNWQDRALAIRQIHYAKKAENPGTTWGYRESGKLFKLDFSHIQSLVIIADALITESFLPEGTPRPITTAPTIQAATDILAAQTQQRLQAELIRRSGALPTPTPSTSTPTPPPSNPTSTLSAFDRLKSDFLTGGSTPPLGDESAGGAAPAKFEIDLGQLLTRGSAMDVMWKMQPGQFDAIVTDPPYGNDLDEVEGIKGVEFVSEHGTEWGSFDMQVFFQRAWKVLKDNAWCFVFYDLRHHEKMIKWANEAGFKTQDFPNVWIKTHPCRNQSPATNWTKATEFVLVCRKGNPVKLDLAYAPNYLAADGLTEKRKSQNPYAKPFEVCEWLMKPWLLPGMKILDPCMGGGSILIHTLRMQAIPYGIEIDEKNFNEGATRLEMAYRTLFGSSANIILPKLEQSCPPQETSE